MEKFLGYCVVLAVLIPVISCTSMPHVPPPAYCFQPADSGRPQCARAAVTLYFFDEFTRTCRQFTYYGCGGNGNRFETKAECRRRCMFTPQPNYGGGRDGAPSGPPGWN